MRAFAFGFLLLVGLTLLEVWPSANAFWQVRLSEPLDEAALVQLEQASATSIVKITDDRTIIVWAGAESDMSELFAHGAYLVLNAYPNVGCGKQSAGLRPNAR